MGKKNLQHYLSPDTDSSESWHIMKSFLKPKGQRDYPTLRDDDKIAMANTDKVQLFAASVGRHFCKEIEHFDSNHFSEVNQFIEDNHTYFYPPEDPDKYRYRF